MSYTPNTSQINSAAQGNSEDMRQTLMGFHAAITNIYAGGTGPLQKVDSTTPANLAAPAPCPFTVAGANGSFTVTITLPQQASGSSAPANSTNAPIYQQLMSSTTPDFSSGNTNYPISTNTHFVFANPGATLNWQLRSSYNQVTWNAWSKFSGSVAAGLQTSAATQPNVSLNQSNFATVDSVAAGGTATVRIYGSGGVGTSWTSILGTTSKVIPGGTVLNVAYGSNLYVAWDGSRYQVKPSLTQVFPDGWIPAGKVSVIANGAGLVLPTFKAIVSGGAIVAIQILTAGNGLTSAPILTITDSTGSGATAVCTVSAGSVTGVTVTNAGTTYSSTPTVTPTGGVSGGVGGGGGAQGQNSGRIYSTGVNG